MLPFNNRVDFGSTQEDSVIGLRLDPYMANWRWYGTGDAYSFSMNHYKESSRPDKKCVFIKQGEDEMEPTDCTSSRKKMCQTKRSRPFIKLLRVSNDRGYCNLLKNVLISHISPCNSTQEIKLKQ